MTLVYEGQKLNPDTYLELCDFDLTALGGSIYHYTNTMVDFASALVWQSKIYQSLPFVIGGISDSGDGTAPARPQISISNVNKFLFAALLSVGPLIGATITRYRTYRKFLDDGAEANPIMHYPIHIFTFTRKITHTRDVLTYELTSQLDLPGLVLPALQILRDNGFPGIGRIRAR
ncbi:MAG: phage minor tail protein L [Burkholderiales bacterium]